MARILAVDDSPTLRLFTKLALSKHHVVVAGSAEEALDLTYGSLIGKQRFQVFLLDVDLPGMNGFDLGQRIRFVRAYDHTPMIFLTSRDCEAAKLRARALGARFLSKSILTLKMGEELAQVIEAAVESAMAQTAIAKAV